MYIGIPCDVKPLELPGIVRHSTCAVHVFAAQVHGITIDTAVRLVYVFPQRNHKLKRRHSLACPLKQKRYAIT